MTIKKQKVINKFLSDDEVNYYGRCPRCGQLTYSKLKFCVGTWYNENGAGELCNQELDWSS